MTTKNKTGRKRIEDANPYKLAEVATARADGLSLRQTVEITGLSKSAIHQLETRNPEWFADVKRKVAASALELSAKASLVARTKVEQLDGYRAALVSKISSQQCQELTEKAPSPQVNVVLLNQLLVEWQQSEEAVAEIEAIELPPEPTTTAPDGKRKTG